ncbi:helix-turn-helix domain-containing protein [Clostridium beijerinckii]|uniref:helix-turn-helix domain-containing protein n=1 Tax=Clostridium beijerinckii TaxID=1520 RepID=UPI0003D2E1B4|nr:helix-turn-helix transcriptional regulator [Clostridium beijerinckii]ALB47591.1 transcriptional regulator [Clostridium beijerinckii NRRL B-598]
MSKSQAQYNKFKEFLLVNNIKQSELAEHIGRSSSFVNNALNGRGARFNSEDLNTIRCLFNIKICEYF